MEVYLLNLGLKSDWDRALLKRWADRICIYYGEPHRYYHTILHIDSMLKLLHKYHNTYNLVNDYTTLVLSIIFHDIVYQPTSNTNETDSIAVFRFFASEVNLPDDVTFKVVKYIECTIKHVVPPEDLSELGECKDTDLALFLDFDLEVLSRAEGQYEEYKEQIRKEYAHYDEKEYCEGRLKVLEAFQNRRVVYFCDPFRREHEIMARRNIGFEIEGLRKQMRGLAKENGEESIIGYQS